MTIEYIPNGYGKADIAVWRAFTPNSEEYFYTGPSYSVWMVPGYEIFWS